MGKSLIIPGADFSVNAISKITETLVIDRNSGLNVAKT